MLFDDEVAFTLQLFDLNSVIYIIYEKVYLSYTKRLDWKRD